MLLVNVVLPYSSVYNKKRSLEDAIRLIASCPLHFASLILSAVGLLLRLTDTEVGEGIEIEKNQMSLLKLFMPTPKITEVKEAFLKHLREERRKAPTVIRVGIFNFVQLAIAVKLALVYSQDTERKPTTQDSDNLLDALLIINEVGIDPYGDAHLDLSQILAVHQPFLLLESPNRYVCRWKMLFEKAFEIAKTNQFSYLDFEQRYKSDLIFEIDKYLVLGWILYHAWDKDRTRTSIAIGVDELREMTKFSNEELDRLLQEFCGDVSYFKAAISEKDAKHPYKNLRLLQKPLLRYKDSLICLNKNFLIMKFAVGFYYRLIDIYQEGKEDAAREEVRSLFGYAFGEYVDEILSRIFPSQRFLKGDSIPQKKGKSRVDGIIDYGHSLILLEYKSSLLPMNARTTTDPTKFKEWQKGNIIHAARQIDDFISQVKKGELDECFGINSSMIRTYYPLVVTLQMLPTAIGTYIQDIESELVKHNLLQDCPSVKPLEVMNVSDLELVEVVVDQGVALIDLVSNKILEARGKNWGSFLQEYYGKAIEAGGRESFFVKKCKEILGEAATITFKPPFL